jgi:hypothetical protein
MASNNKVNSRRGASKQASEPRDRIALLLARAFPLPKSGAFSDLLDALDRDVRS